MAIAIQVRVASSKVGKRITSSRRIIELGKMGRSVWDIYLKRPMPVAWIQNYPFVSLMGQISAGRYYEYKSYGRKKSKTA